MKELEKLSTGIPSLDGILNGGLPRNSVNVIAGPPGTGKTILAQQIVFHNALHDDRAPYLVTVSEPTVKMLRYQQQFTFFDPDRVGQNVIYLDIGSTLLEGDLHELTRQIEEYINKYSPTILAIGSFSLSEFGVSFIADNVILLRYMEMGGRMGRALNVLKVRGSQHDKEIREFEISDQGLRVGKPVKALTGVLTGTPVMGTEWGWRELEPSERYVMEVLKANSPATLAEVAAATMIPPDALEPLIGELAEHGYLLAYGQGDGRKYRVTV